MDTEEKDISKKTLSELEKEGNIAGENYDIPPRYLGVPPSKKFYQEKEVNFQSMRAKFNRLLRWLKLR